MVVEWASDERQVVILLKNYYKSCRDCVIVGGMRKNLAFLCREHQAIYNSGETCHLVWSRMLDDGSERGKHSREDRNENAEKDQGGDSERQNEE